ncbi:MAG: DUF4954 family protein [Bacteroidales bacterium]|nr:DUF4954 family protein [Bacteroidales bacterium]MDD4602584.1 DUF4954 family protein [Bacteroidales bacterium]
MDNVSLVPKENIGRNFIPSEYLPKDKDEYLQRNKQTYLPKSGWRNLKSDEIERLVKNDNTADNWDELLVSDQFDADQIKNTRFYGLVRIGCLRNVILQHHDLRVPAGITNSLIISCDIGDDVAIHNVHYLAHYIIGDRSILFNVQEMHVTDHAKFGNGIIKEGEPENVRTWIELMNETGCRKVLPFDGMITADAYLWAKYVDDKLLQENLKKITQNSFDKRRGYYGMTGNQCVIKNSLILKDVKVGSFCYIKGANKLKNLTINSSEEEPTQIGEGVELVNGIIGYGCHIFYGCKAIKFILGNNSSLKYGARLIHSFLGDNSTISCCEVLNNLIFPAHEQHHNNSFLVASVLMGQSNVAAGATIGSNHNSRANDNEIQAGRGFWPGLCASVKHSSRFASFVLLSKADYPAELDIPFPFSLVNNNGSKDQLEVMPAFWWMFNMYALARNSWKFQSRDKRVNKVQKIEFEPFAPDTIEEVFHARRLLEIWTAKASLRDKGESIKIINDHDLVQLGRKLLSGKEDVVNGLEVLGENMEHTKRKILILKPYRAYHAYGEILHFYAMKNLLAYMKLHPKSTFTTMCKNLKSERQHEWVNLGGQIMQKNDVDKLRSDIGSGKLKTWQDIHNRYDDLWAQYPVDKQKHAFATFCELSGTENLTKTEWNSSLDKAVNIQKFICEQVYISRKKDFDNPFRKATFRNMDEMKAAIGTIDENSFIIQVRQETEDFKIQVEEIKKRDNN